MAKVTDVRIRKGYEEDSKVKAVVSATLDDAYVIHGIKILKSEEGYYIAMPSKKLKEGEFKDIFHPINSEARQILQREILELFDKELEKSEKSEI
ncbi:MAG: SpoVG family protein [Fusobacteria bacterium]|nr:SpoVG family protein [Fusobacteriota bacterium]